MTRKHLFACEFLNLDVHCVHRQLCCFLTKFHVKAALRPYIISCLFVCLFVLASFYHACCYCLVSNFRPTNKDQSIMDIGLKQDGLIEKVLADF